MDPSIARTGQAGRESMAATDSKELLEPEWCVKKFKKLMEKLPRRKKVYHSLITTAGEREGRKAAQMSSERVWLPFQ